MIKHLSLRTLSSYTTQRKNFEGRPHIVAPVVLIVEGIHNGLYYSDSELSQFPNAWNGVPVPIFHPMDGDNPISCNSPEVIEQNNIGRLFNVTHETGKLKGELWIDEAKARQLAPEVLAALLSGRILEVSTGLFSDTDEVSGIWNGEAYSGVARNIRPDHLALLPGQTGACSVADGCGVRINQEKGGDVDIKEIISQFIANKSEMSFEDRRRMIQKVMDSRDVRPMNESGNMVDNYMMHYVIATYDDSFICMRETKTGTEMFKCKYKMNNNNVEIETNEVPVREETNYVEVTTNIETNKEDEKMAEVKKCCPEKVKALIDSTDNKYTEGDRVWINELSPEAFERLVANAVPITKEVKADIVKANTAEEVTANVSDEMKVQVEAGLKLLAEKRTTLITGILANTQNTFTKEDLETKVIGELEKVATLAKVPDFSGQGSASITDNAEKDAESLDLPTINIAKK